MVLAAYSVPGDCYYIVNNAVALTTASAALAPYSGTIHVTTSAAAAPAGTIALPTTAGTSFIDVRGDTMKDDCNAYSPKVSGSSATVQYATGRFPH